VIAYLNVEIINRIILKCSRAFFNRARPREFFVWLSTSSPTWPRLPALAAMRKAAIVLALAAQASAMELTKETWEGAVAGKSVFVKFLAPW